MSLLEYLYIIKLLFLLKISITSLLWVWELGFTFLTICKPNHKEETWQIHIQPVNLLHTRSKIPAEARLISSIKNSVSKWKKSWNNYIYWICFPEKSQEFWQIL